jgi:hypothetical protein
MQRTNQLRTLSLFAILSLTAIQAQAEPVTASYLPQQLAEGGSERAMERANSLRDHQAQKLAENGSERRPERAKRGSKLRNEQAPVVAESGSDRLQLWHQQRSA